MNISFTCSPTAFLTHPKKATLTCALPTFLGHAFAGGAMLAFAHDYRIMRTEKGWFSLPEIHLNLRFGPGMLALIR